MLFMFILLVDNDVVPILGNEIYYTENAYVPDRTGEIPSAMRDHDSNYPNIDRPVRNSTL